MIATATVQFSTLQNAVEYAAGAHEDAVKAVEAAREALSLALSVESQTNVVKATLTKLFEESS